MVGRGVWIGVVSGGASSLVASSLVASLLFGDGNVHCSSFCNRRLRDSAVSSTTPTEPLLLVGALLNSSSSF